MSFRPLSRAPWLEGAGEEIVARSVRECRSRRSLLQCAAAWARLDLPPGDVALYAPDPWQFVTALLGLWHAGRCVWLPGDRLPATVAALSDRGLVLLGEADTPAVDEASGDMLPPLPADPTRRALVLFTSGSSGAPVPITRRFRDLDDELHAFYRHWPLAPGLLASQVSHQHTWGLTAGLLRALTENRPFGLETLIWPQTLTDTLLRLPVAALVSAPPPLARLPATLGDATGRAPGPARVFSAAAALDGDTARRAEKLLQSELIEIYGSAESGAVGWRRPAQTKAFRCLDDVTLSAAGGDIVLHSPRLPDDATTLSPADRLTLDPNEAEHFTLQGRRDRLVKAAGKRLSLEALEARLVAHPEVRRARCLLLDTPEPRLAAVIECDAWRLAFDHASRRRLIAAFQAHLAGAFEAVTRPRHWRLVSRWPQNAQGKFTQNAARALFADLEDRRRPRWLECEETAPDRWQWTLEIPPRLAALAGHFPGRPMVPGVVLIQWARLGAEQCFESPGRWRDLGRVRFANALLPGDRARLALERRADESIAVRLSSHRGEHLRTTLLPTPCPQDAEVGP